MELLAKTRMFCFPAFPYGILFSSRQHRLPTSFDREGVGFYLRGSAALWHGLKVLQLNPGDTILFPSYHCGIELDVIRKAGFLVAFYRIGRDLSIDIDELRRAEELRPRALYVTHYFGFPHPMGKLRELCDASGWALIEDCAHSLFAESEGRPAGTSGDFAIFSLHKYLPMPFGGALVVNNERLGRSSATVSPPSALLLGQIIDLLGRDLNRTALMNLGVTRRLRGFLSELIHRWTLGGSERDASREGGGSLDFLIESKDARIPCLSYWILGKISEREVVELRRRNFATLLNAVSGCRRIKPLISDLPDGACPGFFPVSVAGDPRDFLRWSWGHGVPAFIFWPHLHPELPSEQFPESVWLKKNIVALPVHQGLRSGDLSLLREVIHSWQQAVNGR